MFGTYFSSHKTKSRLKARYKCLCFSFDDLPSNHEINFKSHGGVITCNKFIAVDNDLYESKRCKVADKALLLSQGKNSECQFDCVDLDDIWSTRSNEVLVNKIIISGEAGGGKTWLCKCIAYRWANDHLWNDQFDYIFYLPLQGIQSISSQPGWQSQYKNIPNALSSHILSCYLHHTLKEAGCDIAKLIAVDTHKRSRVLLLIDGYNTTLSQQYTSSAASDASPLLTKILNQALEYPHYILFVRPVSVFKHETIKATDLLLHHETNCTAEYMKQYYSRYILQDNSTHNKGESNGGAHCTAVLELDTREQYNTLGKLLFQSAVVQSYCDYPVFFFLLCFVWREVDREARDSLLAEGITVFRLNAFVVGYLTSEELSQRHQQQQKMQNIDNKTTTENPLNTGSKGPGHSVPTVVQDISAGSLDPFACSTHTARSADECLELVHRAVDKVILRIVARVPALSETRYLCVVIRQYLTAQHLLYILQHSPGESAEVQSVVLFIRSYWHNQEYLILFQCLVGLIAAGAATATSGGVGGTDYPINKKENYKGDTVSDVSTVFWNAIFPPILTVDTSGVANSTLLSLPLNKITVLCHLLTQCVSAGVVSSCVPIGIVNTVNDYLLSNIATISSGIAGDETSVSASAAVDILLTTRYFPDTIATYCLKHISPALVADSTVVSDVSISAGGDCTVHSNGTLANTHFHLKLLSCKQKSVVDLDFFICDTVHSILHDITTEISAEADNNIENNTADRYKSVELFLKILSNLSSDSDYRVSTVLQILIASPATPQSVVTMCIEMLSRMHWTLNELTIAVFNNLLVHPDSSMDVISHTVNALNYLSNDVVELSNTASHSTNTKHKSKSINKVQPQSLTDIIMDNIMHALTAPSVLSHKSPHSQGELVKSVVRLLSQFQVPIDTIVDKNILVLTKHQALITFAGELHSKYLHSIDVLRMLTLDSNNVSNSNNRNSSNNIRHGKQLITSAQLAVIHKSLVTKLNLIETKRYTALQNHDNIQTICKIIPLLCSASTNKSQLVTQLIDYLKHCNVSVQLATSKALLSLASTQPNSVYYSSQTSAQSVFTTDHKNTIFAHISATAASSPATRCVAVTLSRILLTLCKYSSEEINRIFEKILKLNTYAIFLRVNVVHIIAVQYPKYLTAAMVNSMLEVYGNTNFHNNWLLTMHSTMIAIIASKTEYFLFENWVVATMSRHSQHCKTVELLEIVAEKFPELVSPRIIESVVKCIVTHSKPLEKAIIRCVERIIRNKQIDNNIISHLWVTFDSDIWVKILLNSAVENNILDLLLTHRASTVSLEVFHMFVAQLLTHRHSNDLCATFLKRIISVSPEYASTELVRIVSDFPVLATNEVSLQLPTACVFIAIVAECLPDLITTAVFEQLLQLSNSFMYYPSHLEVLTMAIVRIFPIAHIHTIVTTDHCLQLASMQFDSRSKPLIVKALVYIMDSLPELLSFDTLAELYLRQSKVYLFESIAIITQQYPQYLTAPLVDKIFALMDTCQISAKQAVEVFIVTLLEHRNDLCSREYFNNCLTENKKHYAAMVLLNVILDRNDSKNLDQNNCRNNQMNENSFRDFGVNNNTMLSVYVDTEVVQTIYQISTTTHVFQTGLFAILRSTLMRLLCALPVCSELRDIVQNIVINTISANNNNTTKTSNTWNSNSQVNNYVNSGLELRDIGALAAVYPTEVCVVDDVMSYVTSKLTIHDHSAAVVKEAVVAFERLIIHLYQLAQKTRDERIVNNNLNNSSNNSCDDIEIITLVIDNDHLIDKLVPLLSHNYNSDIKGGANTSTGDVSILQTTILSVHHIVAAYPQCFTVEICDALMAILFNKHISSHEKTTTAIIESIFQTPHTALVPSNGSGDSGDSSTVFSQRNLSYLDIHTIMNLFENSDGSASVSVVVVYGQLLLLLLKNELQRKIVGHSSSSIETMRSDVGVWQSHLVALFHIALKHYMTHSGSMFHTADADRLFALFVDILQLFATLLDNSSSGNVSDNSNHSNNEIISNEIIISKEFIQSKLSDLLTNYLVDEQHKKTWKIITEIVNKCPVFVDSWLVGTLFAQLASGSERQDRLQSLASTISFTAISTILTTYPESTTTKLITLPLLLSTISSKVYTIKFYGTQLLQQFVEKFSHVLSTLDVENIVPLLLDVHKEPQIIFEKVITFCVSRRSDLITSSFLLSKLRDNDKDLKMIEQYAKLITITVQMNKDAISRDIVTTLFTYLTSTKQPMTWHTSCFEAVFEALAHCIVLRSDLDFCINVLLDIVWKGTASSGNIAINPHTMKCFCIAVQLCCQHQPHSVTQRMVDVVVHMLHENVSYSTNAVTVCMSISTFCPQFISFALIDGLLMWAYDCSVVCGTTNLVKSYFALEVLTYLCSYKVEKSEVYKQYVLSHEALNCLVLRTIIDYEVV